MVEISTLIVSIVSLVGTFTIAAVTLLFQYFSDERKRLSETDKLLRKYRDPVLWATSELQSRLYSICELNILGLYGDPSKRDLVVVFTCYLVGQYFAWTSIFRRQAQFLSIGSQKDHKRLNDLLDTINTTFLTSSKPLGAAPFMVWRGQQSAISEVMTVRDGGKDDAKELLSMGYAAFTKKWTEDATFRAWFAPIEQGVVKLAGMEAFERPKLRIVYLQHLLYELMSLLDKDGLQWDKGNMKQCKIRDGERKDCKCTTCKDATTRSTLARKGEV